MVKNLPIKGFDPWEDLLEKEMATPMLLPGKSLEQRSLARYTVHGVTKSQTRLSE